MRSSKKALLFAAVLSFLTGATALAGPVASDAVVGKFGFDWLNPRKFKCVAITPEAAVKFKSCSYEGPGGTGSFSDKADFYKCQAGEKSELMIYKTMARCAEELEIMKSNGD